MRIVAAAIALTATVGMADTVIVTDGAVGDTGGGRLTLSDGAVQISPDEGAQRESNLFHSFSRFELDDGVEAVFVTPATIERIISRVTSPAGARIDGVVLNDTGASVDFWMISPGGIAIGARGEIDLNGSIHLAAADTLYFDRGWAFSTETEGRLQLSLAEPRAFGFLERAPGQIIVRSETGLGNVNGDLSLVGGVIDIEGARIATSAPSDRRETILIAGAGRGDVVAVRGRDFGRAPAPLKPGAGVIRIRGEPLDNNNSTTELGINGGGLIALHGGEVDVDGASIRIRSTNEGVIGSGIRIDAREITIKNNGVVQTSASETQDAGGIIVSGFERLLVQGVSDQPGDADDRLETVIESQSSPSRRASSDLAMGNAGDILVHGSDVILKRSGRISSETLSQASAGRVTVDARSIELLGGGQISSGVKDPDSSSNSGDDGQTFIARTGRGGIVKVRASEQITIAGRAVNIGGDNEPSGIFTSTESLNGGDAGAVMVTARAITLSRTGEIASETFNASLAGDVTVNADRIVVKTGAEITARVVDRNRDLDSNRSAVKSSTEEPVNVDKPFLGNAGNVVIQRRSDNVGSVIILRDASGHSFAEVASNASSGIESVAGTVKIEMDRIELLLGGSINTDSSANQGGEITLSGKDLLLVEGGRITTSIADLDGDGGQIIANGLLTLILNEGLIQANSGEIVGIGGKVTLSSDFTIRDFSASTVDARGAEAPGEIEILGEASIDTGERNALPSEFFDRFALVDDGCVAAVTGGSSLSLEPKESSARGSDAITPALFGEEIPYPKPDRPQEFFESQNSDLIEGTFDCTLY